MAHFQRIGCLIKSTNPSFDTFDVPMSNPLPQQKWYPVFKPELDTAAHDPLDPDKRYHEGIFIETNPGNRKGTLFHVTGDIIAAGGMRYEEKDNYTPEVTAGLNRSVLIGWVLKADYDSGRISTILKALPTPPKQQGLNFWAEPGRMTEMIWTKENGERYGPDEQRLPIFKCNEWTNNHAIPALREAGILRESV
ncbi:conserved hypothetical protein [Histoplasma capsulatum var. duboisii H88]|uniref:Uncharacterized protein n=1 Tax=Ajellomyces capsulatus (strain H88) TaxID=544711 RepID=F0USK2_AJEC8|nr:conserved hypothetical protein [Histoplasma capsulatum var. duboisii H88]